MRIFHTCFSVCLLFQPLSRSLNADVPEQLITPLVSLGHISMLAPDQFASPMKSIVANFIVKDLLMNDRVRILMWCSALIMYEWFYCMLNEPSLPLSLWETKMGGSGQLTRRFLLKCWLR